MSGVKRETVPGLATAISQAMAKQRIDSVQALAALTGLTRQGLDPLLRGDRKKYQTRLKHPVCRALGWTETSIDRLLAGLEPIEVSSPAASEDEELGQLRFEVMQEIDRQAQLLEEVRAGARADAEALHAAVLELQHRIEALEQRGRGSV